MGRDENGVASKGLRDQVAKQVAMVWACVAKKDNDWVKKLWSMKWRVPGQEVNQRKLGQRLWKKMVKYVD